jgi:hypothetical protein
MKSVQFLFLYLMMVASCKKSGADNIPDKVSVYIDGVKTTFNSGALAISGSVSGLFLLNISGAQDPTQKSNTIGFGIASIDAIKIGSYHQSPTGVSMQYIQPGGQYVARPTSQIPATITITSLAYNNVQGTFSGTVYFNGDTTLAKKVLTDGQFNVGF